MLGRAGPGIPRLTHRDDDEARVNAAPGEAPLAGHSCAILPCGS